MRMILIAAMLLGAGTGLQAQSSRHQAVYLRHAEDFMGLYESRPAVPPTGFGGNACNGGRCTQTGGPSGGPNQS